MSNRWATLAEACRLGAYRAVHRASAAQRHVRAQLAVRDALIRTRTRYVSVVKALVRRDGLRLPPGDPVHTEAKLAALSLAPPLADEVAPLRVILGPLNAQIAVADSRLATVAAADPWVERLRTAPGIGPVTAVAFVATLDGRHAVRECPPRGRLSRPHAAGVRFRGATAPGAERGRGRAGAAARRHPVRDVARRGGLPRARPASGHHSGIDDRVRRV